MSTGEYLIAAKLYISEGFTYIRAFVAPGDNFEQVKEFLASSGDPITVREIEIDLKREEFTNLFKRLDIVLTWRGLDLTDREYSIPR